MVFAVSFSNCLFLSHSDLSFSSHSYTFSSSSLISICEDFLSLDSSNLVRHPPIFIRTSPCSSKTLRIFYATESFTKVVIVSSWCVCVLNLDQALSFLPNPNGSRDVFSWLWWCNDALKEAPFSLSPRERDRQNWGASQKKRFLYFLGYLSFWVSGVESPLIFYTKNKKN